MPTPARPAPRSGATHLLLMIPLLALLPPLAGCGGTSQSADEDAGLPPRAETFVDTLAVEGMPMPVPMRLVTWQGEGSLPASFYVPEGMEVVEMPAEEGGAIRFTAAFGGQPDSAAFVHIYAHPAGTAEEQARNFVQGILTGLQVPGSPHAEMDTGEPGVPTAGSGQAPAAAGTSGPLPLEDTTVATARTDRFPWALTARTFRVPPTGAIELSGGLALGRHGERFFHVLYRYPPEYSDGMGPRIDAILSSWRWEDTGEMLVGG